MRYVSIKTVVGIGMILVVVLGIFGCDFLPGEPRKVEFLDNSFAVTMPGSWSLRNDLNDSADLQMGNAFKEAYTVILSDNKMDLDNFSLEQHSNLTRSFIADAVQNYQESSPEYLYVGEFESIRYEIEGTVDGIRARYWHVTVETENFFHQFIIWSLKSKFSNNEEDFNALLQSFEAIQGG